MADPTVVAVLGPTATGKSALALVLAERYDGEIISCDSTVVSLMQMGGISQREPFRARNENFRARVRWLGLRPWMIAHYVREVATLARGRFDRFVEKLLK